MLVKRRKKKLNLCREETDRAVTKANALESAATEANDKAEKMEEKQRHFQKKLNEKVKLVFTIIHKKLL